MTDWDPGCSQDASLDRSSQFLEGRGKSVAVSFLPSENLRVTTAGYFSCTVALGPETKFLTFLSIFTYLSPNSILPLTDHLQCFCLPWPWVGMRTKSSGWNEDHEDLWEVVPQYKLAGNTRGAFWVGKGSTRVGGQKSFQQMLSIIGPHRDLWVYLPGSPKPGNNGFGGLHFSKLKPDFICLFLSLA